MIYSGAPLVGDQAVLRINNLHHLISPEDVFAEAVQVFGPFMVMTDTWGLYRRPAADSTAKPPFAGTIFLLGNLRPNIECRQLSPFHFCLASTTVNVKKQSTSMDVPISACHAALSEESSTKSANALTVWQWLHTGLQLKQCRAEVGSRCRVLVLGG